MSFDEDGQHVFEPSVLQPAVRHEPLRRSKLFTLCPYHGRYSPKEDSLDRGRGHKKGKIWLRDKEFLIEDLLVRIYFVTEII